MLQEITTEFIYHFFMVFARLGMAFSIFPALNEKTILLRGRLIFALATSLVILPLVASYLPGYTENYALIISFISIEMVIGLLISIAAKFYFWSVQIVGQIISMQSGLGSANFFDPSHGMQNPIFANFLILFTTTFIFASDSHYFFINAVIESYERFPPVILPEMADMTKFVTKVMNDSFILAFKLSSPFLIISLAILVGSGILARLMPNLQVFFVITPAQILVMFGILYIVINSLIAKLVEAIVISTNF